MTDINYFMNYPLFFNTFWGVDTYRYLAIMVLNKKVIYARSMNRTSLSTPKGFDTTDRKDYSYRCHRKHKSSIKWNKTFSLLQYVVSILLNEKCSAHLWLYHRINSIPHPAIGRLMPILPTGSPFKRSWIYILGRFLRSI